MPVEKRRWPLRDEAGNTHLELLGSPLIENRLALGERAEVLRPEKLILDDVTEIVEMLVRAKN